MDGLSVGHPSIDRVLHLYALSLPQQAGRAASALSVILRHIQESAWEEVIWEFSRLTGGGFPIEFTFSPATDTISYAAEVAPPEVDTASRLKMARDLLLTLGAAPIPEPIYQALQQLQQSSTLQYGAWVAGRHDALQDRYKLYAEVPPDNTAYAYEIVRNFTIAPLLLTNPAIHPKMIGYDLYTNRTEFYFRVEKLNLWDVAELMNSVGFVKQAPALLKFIQQVSKRSGDADFLGANTGFSLAFSKYGTPVAFSLFAFARAVFRGGDAHIRTCLLQQLNCMGTKWQTYEQVSELLANSTTRKTYHGMVTFTITEEGKTALQVGLRPPYFKHSNQVGEASFCST